MTWKQSTKYTCRSCNATYVIGSEATVLVYLKQHWFDHLVIRCLGCNQITLNWGLTLDDLKYLESLNVWAEDTIVFVVKEFANRSVETAFCNATGRSLPREANLTPRQQQTIDHYVAFFEHLLASAGPEDITS